MNRKFLSTLYATLAVIFLISGVLFGGYGEEGVDDFAFEPIVEFVQPYMQVIAIVLSYGLGVFLG